KIWHFGTLSLCFQIPIQEGTSWSELIKIASWIENDQAIDIIAKNKSKAFQTDIKTAIPIATDWETFEDYVTYFVQEFDGYSGSIAQLGDHADIPALILAESKEILSD